MCSVPCNELIQCVGLFVRTGSENVWNIDQTLCFNIIMNNNKLLSVVVCVSDVQKRAPPPPCWTTEIVPVHATEIVRKFQWALGNRLGKVLHFMWLFTRRLNFPFSILLTYNFLKVEVHPWPCHKLTPRTWFSRGDTRGFNSTRSHIFGSGSDEEAKEGSAVRRRVPYKARNSQASEQATRWFSIFIWFSVSVQVQQHHRSTWNHFTSLI